MYRTHIVAARTPNSHFASRDKLRMSSQNAPHTSPLVCLLLQGCVLKTPTEGPNRAMAPKHISNRTTTPTPRVPRYSSTNATNAPFFCARGVGAGTHGLCSASQAPRQSSPPQRNECPHPNRTVGGAQHMMHSRSTAPPCKVKPPSFQRPAPTPCYPQSVRSPTPASDPLCIDALTNDATNHHIDAKSTCCHEQRRIGASPLHVAASRGLSTS